MPDARATWLTHPRAWLDAYSVSGQANTAHPPTRHCMTTPQDLPFPRYPGGGTKLLGKPREGDGTARRSYGLKALEWCGHRCAYCGLDMSVFEGWPLLSIDHVIPQQSVGAG